jgi:uncharacterized membrane protein
MRGKPDKKMKNAMLGTKSLFAATRYCFGKETHWRIQMKRKFKYPNGLAAVIGATVLLPILLTATTPLAAQQSRFRLVDLGTLGGSHSYGEINGMGIPLLNNSGIVGSWADTAMPDPNAPDCQDCFLAHAFRWKHGAMSDLGALPGINFSAAGSTNARGWMAGQSYSSTIDPNLGNQEIRAVLWKNHGYIHDLGVLPGGTESLSVYVNDAGQVVGFSDNGVPDPNSLAFFFTGNTDPYLSVGERNDARHWNAGRRQCRSRCELQ